MRSSERAAGGARAGAVGTDEVRASAAPPSLGPWLDGIACPACGGALGERSRTLVCGGCGAIHAITDGIPALLVEPGAAGDEAAAGAAGVAGVASGAVAASGARVEAVRRFYTAAPFPGYRPNDTWDTLRARAARSAFARALDQAIPLDARVVEVGCGTGQMTLFLATADRQVVGADLTRASLALGADAARRFGVSRALFVETDLHRPGLRAGAFDVVVSLGVLHHTPDPRAAFARLARLARPGGMIVVGLYNAFARLPHRLRRWVARLSGMRIIPFDPVLGDRRAEPDRRDAWIRDQYLHPEEHRHTLGEVQRWFRANQVDYIRAYPDAMLGGGGGGGDGARDGGADDRQLFDAAEDNWWPEGILAQLQWMRTLGHEGGLFVVVGRRR